MIYDYQAMCSALDVLSPWKQKAICATCLEKVAPVARYLAFPQTWKLVQQGLILVWQAANDESASGQECMALMAELHQTAEWNCNDSDTLFHVVAQALSFVDLAMKAACSSDPATHAKQSLGLIVDFAGPFDYAASQRNSPELDPHIVTSEMESQCRIVEIVMGRDRTRAQVIESMRKEGLIVASLFCSLLPTYCYQHVQRIIQARSSG